MTPWRVVVLLRVAARAERIRLRLWLRRLARRGVLAMVAAVLLLNLTICLHVAAVLALGRWLRPEFGALVVAASDAGLAGLLLGLALRDHPGASEREATRLGREARGALTDLAGPVLVLAPALGRLARRVLRRGGAR